MDNLEEELYRLNSIEQRWNHENESGERSIIECCSNQLRVYSKNLEKIKALLKEKRKTRNW